MQGSAANSIDALIQGWQLHDIALTTKQSYKETNAATKMKLTIIYQKVNNEIVKHCPQTLSPGTH